jgi:uncharacterized protein YecE (DUF72 family)
MAIDGYYLGCPGWGVKTWVGRLFPSGTRPTEFLERYARVFNTVEGNTTFYALPPAETVARWRDQVPDSFRFCFKFPRTITHDKLLVDCAGEVATFLERVAPLGAKLGTLFLQLPPQFDGTRLSRLDRFLASLPAGGRYAVEFRHEAFFRGEPEAPGAPDGPEGNEALALLRARGVDLVVMDTRGLHAGNSLALAEVRARKPRMPVIMRATAAQPLVRCVPHESFDATRPFVEPWAAQIARWIALGKRPYFFMHAPDDTFAPENAYAFHAMVRRHRDVGELPPWPGGPRQLSLL